MAAGTLIFGDVCRGCSGLRGAASEAKSVLTAGGAGDWLACFMFRSAGAGLIDNADGGVEAFIGFAFVDEKAEGAEGVKTEALAFRPVLRPVLKPENAGLLAEEPKTEIGAGLAGRVVGGEGGTLCTFAMLIEGVRPT